MIRRLLRRHGDTVVVGGALTLPRSGRCAAAGRGGDRADLGGVFFLAQGGIDVEKEEGKVEKAMALPLESSTLPLSWE